MQITRFALVALVIPIVAHAQALCNGKSCASDGTPIDLSGFATVSAVNALQATIPTPSTTVPPCVADTGTAGTSSTLVFAMANHTHCSKIRKARVTGVNTASYTYTYATAFTTGVVPICQVTVEDPANSASDSYNVEVVGTPTATSVTFRIIRMTSGLLSLLTGALSLNPTPGTVNLHISCFEP